LERIAAKAFTAAVPTATAAEAMAAVTGAVIRAIMAGVDVAE